MSSLEDSPFAFDHDPLATSDFEQPDDGAARGAAAGRGRGRRAAVLLAVASVALAAVALGLGASEGGWAAVAVGALAYLLAVASDLRSRLLRRARRNYRRPWPAALLRPVVFSAALGAAWLAAEGLASP